MSNPTEEQVEAAAKALRDDHANRVDGWKVPEWENLPHGFKIEYRGKARAALVAAAQPAWLAILTPDSGAPRTREWRGLAASEDEAIEQAMDANPGWSVHTFGPDVNAPQAAPTHNGKCGGCRDLGPHRDVPGCEYYRESVRAMDEGKLAEVAAPEEPTYSPRARSWSSMCPCVLAEQVDPECEWHGRPEFRHGGELSQNAPSNQMVIKAARVLHIASCCKLDEGAEHQEPQNEDLFAAGVVLNAVPLAAPVQVDEAKLITLVIGKTATTAARDIAEWLRGGAQ